MKTRKLPAPRITKFALYDDDHQAFLQGRSGATVKLTTKLEAAKLWSGFDACMKAHRELDPKWTVFTLDARTVHPNLRVVNVVIEAEV